MSRWEEEGLGLASGLAPAGSLSGAFPPPPPQVLALWVAFLTCAMAPGGWWWGTVFGSWNQPEVTSAAHTPVPHCGRCRVGPADSFELDTDQPSPLPSPADPGRAFPWPGSELPAHPVWPTRSICPTSPASSWRWARAALTSEPPAWGGERADLQRGLQPRGPRTGETRAPPCRGEMEVWGLCQAWGTPHRTSWGSHSINACLARLARGTHAPRAWYPLCSTQHTLMSSTPTSQPGPRAVGSGLTPTA